MSFQATQRFSLHFFFQAYSENPFGKTKHLKFCQDSKSERAANQVEELKERQYDLQQCMGKLVRLAEHLNDPDRHLVFNPAYKAPYTSDCFLGAKAGEETYPNNYSATTIFPCKAVPWLD